MRALLIARTFPPRRGGTATVYHHVCRELAPDVTALTWRYDPETDDAYDREQRFPVRRIPWLAPLGAAAARHERFRADNLFEFGAVRAATSAWIAEHVARERPDVVCIGELRTGYWIARLVRRLSRARVVFYTHGEELADEWRSRFVGRRHFAALREADGVVAVSRFARDRLFVIGVPPGRIEVIESGVELDRFTPGTAPRALLERFGLQDRRILLTVGRSEPRKGQDTVIRALPAIAERVPDVRYLIVGGGHTRPELEALASSLGVRERVVFAGGLSDEELVDCYRACDVFVMANRTLEDGDTEGYGLVFLEAGACGKPAVGGRAGGAPEAITEGVTGLLVDGTSPDDTAAALTRLLTDGELARAMGEAGLARARTQSWGVTAERFRAFCERVRDGALPG